MMSTQLLHGGRDISSAARQKKAIPNAFSGMTEKCLIPAILPHVLKSYYSRPTKQYADTAWTLQNVTDFLMSDLVSSK